MDPVSVGLLAALAGGVGGEIGRQAWAALSELVRRPFRGGQDTEDVPAVSSGVAELAELERAPADPAPAQRLSTALAVRAAVDADFRAGLEQWNEQARLVRTGDGEVHNTISGGTFHGPTLQGQTFSRISFTTPPPPPADRGPDTPSTQS
ncbi:hypothetical protein [Streptomyces jeddahensis]|uniref:Uncharacterized protein n=1 Tax=Streptomyces jeddahensis TaxID=1716141 RepID=A0A177HHQ5_9ACTN|nr:hypothetical protein [Streptomyces jeddahensis]OAH10246.1 hypothetical protein STSP_65020 [Streptomyces jeddahensis]